MKSFAKTITVFTAVSVLMAGMCACSSSKEDETTGADESIEEPEETEPTEASDPTQGGEESGRLIPYRCASREEGAELMLGNKAYYEGFSQNELGFKMMDDNATMEEYLAFAAEQVMDFEPEELEFVESMVSRMEDCITENGYVLPPLDEIVFIKTTMLEEPGAAGYTHGTQIYVGADYLQYGVLYTDDQFVQNQLFEFFFHELFHCLTRCNPDFRADMYSLISFTIEPEDYELPASVLEYHISNPDVEHHDAHATFVIGGEEIECFTDFVTTMHYGECQTDFFSVGNTALIPIDGSDVFYTPEDAENFYDVFGSNTGYVIDPEECMADNFSYAMVYGMEGPDGEGYADPEIIEGIIDCLTP